MGTEIYTEQLLYNSCPSINDTFKRMFSDSKLTEEFSMITSKVLYIVNHGPAPDF